MEAGDVPITVQVRETGRIHRPEFTNDRVADNGPDIPEDQRQDTSGRGEKGLESSGAGIGLYPVRSPVESYGGDVWIEDNDPGGSVFVVSLPTAE